MKNNEIEKFIDSFVSYATRNKKDEDIVRSLFGSGYCYHFAHILKSTFCRGKVVWVAPFGHICWEDEDGIAYDICGQYKGKTFYLIPEEFAEKSVNGFALDFKHIPGMHCNITKSEIIKICKSYCKYTGCKYNPEIEDFVCEV